jgi:ADP-heptose:LPS heptosyltransferase
LGDTLLTLPAIAACKAACPSASIALLVQPALQPLLAPLPIIDRVMVMPSWRACHWVVRAMRIGSWLKSERFDAVVVAHPMKEWHVAVWWAGIPIRIGYDRKWGRLLTHRIPDEKALGEHHEVEYNLKLLHPLGIEGVGSVRPELPVYPESARRIEQLFDSVGVAHMPILVAVHPWTSNPAKQWPLDRFRDLIHRLAQQPNVGVVVIGGTEEQTRAATLLAGRAGRIWDAVGQLSLTEVAACLRRVRVLVTNDSGPMHVAAAVGTPVVALFGTADPGSHPRRWGPCGAGHHVLHKPLDMITVEEVLQATQASYLSRA